MKLRQLICPLLASLLLCSTAPSRNPRSVAQRLWGRGLQGDGQVAHFDDSVPEKSSCFLTCGNGQQKFDFINVNGVVSEGLRADGSGTFIASVIAGCGNVTFAGQTGPVGMAPRARLRVSTYQSASWTSSRMLYRSVFDVTPYSLPHIYLADYFMSSPSLKVKSGQSEQTDIDEFAYLNQDTLVIVPAGSFGKSVYLWNGSPIQLYPYISGIAAGKNVLTVGSVFNTADEFAHAESVRPKKSRVDIVEIKLHLDLFNSTTYWYGSQLPSDASYVPEIALQDAPIELAFAKKNFGPCPCKESAASQWWKGDSPNEPLPAKRSVLMLYATQLHMCGWSIVLHAWRYLGGSGMIIMMDEGEGPSQMNLERIRAKMSQSQKYCPGLWDYSGGRVPAALLDRLSSGEMRKLLKDSTTANWELIEGATVSLATTRGSEWHPDVSRFVSPETMSPWSPMGGTADGRLKPDIVEVGHPVTGASAEQIETVAGSCPQTYKEGTVASAAVTAGLALLVRQYFTDGHHNSISLVPSSSLLRAVLVSAAEPLKGFLTSVNETWEPTESSWVAINKTRHPEQWYGHGLVDYDRIFGNDTLEVRDRLSMGPGEVLAFCFVTNSPVPRGITVAIAWIDMPDWKTLYSHLVVDFDLIVRSPSGKVYAGNRNGTFSSFDTLNTIEKIKISNPEVGVYTVLIKRKSVAASTTATQRRNARAASYGPEFYQDDIDSEFSSEPDPPASSARVKDGAAVSKLMGVWNVSLALFLPEGVKLGQDCRSFNFTGWCPLPCSGSCSSLECKCSPGFMGDRCDIPMISEITTDGKRVFTSQPANTLRYFTFSLPLSPYTNKFWVILNGTFPESSPSYDHTFDAIPTVGIQQISGKGSDTVRVGSKELRSITKREEFSALWNPRTVIDTYSIKYNYLFPERGTATLTFEFETGLPYHSDRAIPGDYAVGVASPEARPTDYNLRVFFLSCSAACTPHEVWNARKGPNLCSCSKVIPEMVGNGTINAHWVLYSRMQCNEEDCLAKCKGQVHLSQLTAINGFCQENACHCVHSVAGGSEAALTTLSARCGSAAHQFHSQCYDFGTPGRRPESLERVSMFVLAAFVAVTVFLLGVLLQWPRIAEFYLRRLRVRDQGYNTVELSNMDESHNESQRLRSGEESFRDEEFEPATESRWWERILEPSRERPSRVHP